MIQQHTYSTGTAVVIFMVVATIRVKHRLRHNLAATVFAAMTACLPCSVAASSPPLEPDRERDRIVHNATELAAIIWNNFFSAKVPLALHLVGHFKLGELPFQNPHTFLVVDFGQSVTLWSEVGEATLDGEGRGRIVVVRAMHLAPPSPTPISCYDFMRRLPNLPDCL